MFKKITIILIFAIMSILPIAAKANGGSASLDNGILYYNLNCTSYLDSANTTWGRYTGVIDFHPANYPANSTYTYWVTIVNQSYNPFVNQLTVSALNGYNPSFVKFTAVSGASVYSNGWSSNAVNVAIYSSDCSYNVQLVVYPYQTIYGASVRGANAPIYPSLTVPL